MPREQTFKFDSQHVFLTYAQLDVPVQELYDALVALNLADIVWARICREDHEDGGKHLHAVIKFNKRVQSRRSNFLDLFDKHPNIQKLRSIPKALAYVAKDGEFVDYGPVPHTERRASRDLLELARTAGEEEYWVACAEARLPYQYALQFWKMAHADYNETIFEYTGGLDRERADLQITPLPERKSIVLVGPTGVGKTSWAKRMAPKPCLWVRHVDVLRSYRPGFHKSIIFDDMVFEQWPVQSQIHLTDEHDSAHIHCRYGHATIPAETLKIFTCNQYPFKAHEAIERRVHLIYLY